MASPYCARPRCMCLWSQTRRIYLHINTFFLTVLCAIIVFRWRGKRLESAGARAGISASPPARIGNTDNAKVAHKAPYTKWNMFVFVGREGTLIPLPVIYAAWSYFAAMLPGFPVFFSATRNMQVHLKINYSFIVIKQQKYIKLWFVAYFFPSTQNIIRTNKEIKTRAFTVWTNENTWGAAKTSGVNKSPKKRNKRGGVINCYSAKFVQQLLQTYKHYYN